MFVIRAKRQGCGVEMVFSYLALSRRQRSGSKTSQLYGIRCPGRASPQGRASAPRHTYHFRRDLACLTPHSSPHKTKQGCRYQLVIAACKLSSLDASLSAKLRTPQPPLLSKCVSVIVVFTWPCPSSSCIVLISYPSAHVENHERPTLRDHPY